MTPSDSAAAATAPMLGGPSPWTREPIHSAASGPPVQMFDVTTAMAHTIAVRCMRPTYSRRDVSARAPSAQRDGHRGHVHARRALGVLAVAVPVESVSAQQQPHAVLGKV